MLASERAADGERAACGGGAEWTPEGDLKFIQGRLQTAGGCRVWETENKLR